jgi:hypothetical protein
MDERPIKGGLSKPRTVRNTPLSVIRVAIIQQIHAIAAAPLRFHFHIATFIAAGLTPGPLGLGYGPHRLMATQDEKKAP